MLSEERPNIQKNEKIREGKKMLNFGSSKFGVGGIGPRPLSGSAPGSFQWSPLVRKFIVRPGGRFIYVTVLGHSPLSRPVAWRRSSSPIRLGYRRYTSTHPLNALQMVAPGAAI